MNKIIYAKYILQLVNSNEIDNNVRQDFYTDIMNTEKDGSKAMFNILLSTVLKVQIFQSEKGKKDLFIQEYELLNLNKSICQFSIIENILGIFLNITDYSPLTSRINILKDIAKNSNDLPKFIKDALYTMLLNQTLKNDLTNEGLNSLEEIISYLDTTSIEDFDKYTNDLIDIFTFALNYS